MEFFLADMCESVLNVFRIRTQKTFIIIYFEQKTFKLTYMPTSPVPVGGLY